MFSSDCDFIRSLQVTVDSEGTSPYQLPPADRCTPRSLHSDPRTSYGNPKATQSNDSFEHATKVLQVFITDLCGDFLDA